MDQDNRNDHNDRNDRHDREPNRSWWWWIAGAGALLLLGMLMYNPMNMNRNNTPTPITDRGPTSDMSPSGTPITDSTRMTPDNNATGMQAQLNERVTNAVKSVDGVRDAWAVTTPMPNMSSSSTAGSDDTFALVGVNLESSIRGDSEDSTLEEIKAAVKNIPDIDQVMVSSAPTIVNRIKDVSEGIAQGEPMTKFESDMNAIIRDMMPTTGR
jgi:YhcN/YlaJ family sporulation lipoprotein